jgi:hypothetical protein
VELGRDDSGSVRRSASGLRAGSALLGCTILMFHVKRNGCGRWSRAVLSRRWCPIIARFFSVGVSCREMGLPGTSGSPLPQVGRRERTEFGIARY